MASYHKVMSVFKRKHMSTLLKECVIKRLSNAMPHYSTECHTLNQKDLEHCVNRENLPLTQCIPEETLRRPRR